MLAKIAAFELRYQLRSPLFFIVFALFFILAFISVVSDTIQIGARGNVNINSPYAILQANAIMNAFGMFVLVAFVANVVIRDDETGFAPIVRATRIGKFDYLVGRFVGAWAVSVAVMSSVPLAFLVGSWMPWLDSEKLGPLMLSHYWNALAVHTAPSMFALGAIFFALATATRSMMWTYVGAIAFIVLYVTTQLFLAEPHLLTYAALADPLGISALEAVARYWTAAERNSLLPPLQGLFLYNRLIWIAVGVAAFALAYALFKFETVGTKVKRARIAESESNAVEAIPIKVPTSTVHRDASVVQLIALTRFDMRFVFMSPAFVVLLALGALNSYGSMQSIVEDQGTHYFPVTRAIIEVLQGSFVLFSMIIAIYYAGELVWRDRDRRINEIVDATAAPNWTFLVPKVIAIALVLLACQVFAAFIGTMFQIGHGYSHLQIGAYLSWYIVPGLILSLLLASLSVFIQAIVPHKAIGWGFMLVYLIGFLTLGNAGFEHNLYNYGSTSGVPLSDMNGMGRFWIGRFWFQLYWLAFALLLLAIAQMLWLRGVDTRLGPRLKRMRTRFVGAARWVTLGSLVVACGAGAFIFYNTNILNDYRTAPEIEEQTANYEKTLLQFEKVPQPRITDVELKVDIYPKETRVQSQGRYTLENRTDQPLSEIHVRWVRPLKMELLEVDGASLKKQYEDYDYRIYSFANPMQPGEKRELRFAAELRERGFPNRRALTTVVENGTFVNNVDIAPMLGMNRSQLLQERSKRRKHGLPADLRPPKLEDQSASANHYLRNDSDWVNAQLTVTTDADQTPVAPGYKVSDSVSAGRRTLVTRTDAPIMHFFSMQSARYAVKQDSWSRPDGALVELAVYYHATHDHNVDRMLAAMKTSLALFSERFSPFQFRQARILEFPAYERFAQSFANTMPYSEAIGFVQKHDDAKNDEQIDLVTYVTAHEVGHQWWAHQIIGAEKQGMTVLSETFAQYSALMVMEHLYGKEQLRKFLKRELDAYLRSRGGEVVEELPLIRVENQPYIYYRKGSLVMYWLKEVVGESVVNQALRNLLAEFAFKPAPYPSSTDFLRHLRTVADDKHDPLISDLFEKITLYDMKAAGAQAKPVADGRYEITFEVEGKKLYADGLGKETEAALDEGFDIGAFEVEPGKKGYTRQSVIVLERRTMRSGKQSVSLTVDRKPAFVGVDPFNMRIDRNSDDNITSVSLKE